ncbi:hypothetical protein [Fredinandcohnia sp. 179-A 10B2 NHS]|uniref:hypothetical protein n=1 Tax=Fredinandcohnia sp. 179-A 10B2 NHS TaxID=3235176 RepID=UPI0039A0AF1B
MTSKEETFEEFLKDSFANDVYFRELRLSNVEADYVSKKYPNASMKKCSEESPDGKCWYEVNLLPSTTTSSEPQSLESENQRLKEELKELELQYENQRLKAEIEALKLEAENQRLKAELDALRKSLSSVK